ncbi:hypothetical protein [Paracoccus benzoatiresistens]|uniref:Uncharacterized protein n=1 Tax=Paracoccus benzoatiresistens TaxID=2997341 RepID=A0ABT4J218_9RHOB|nr:hypothetical protein [Paracoccus sp. EF6]MCZ0961147.1 hypothetical protein [Paracoccus sp. EF6]
MPNGQGGIVARLVLQGNLAQRLVLAVQGNRTSLPPLRLCGLHVPEGRNAMQEAQAPGARAVEKTNHLKG